jgi:hypothetical protein
MYTLIKTISTAQGIATPDVLSGLGIIALVLLFTGAILGVVKLTGGVSALWHSIAVIKTVHTVVFVLLSVLLAALVYEVLANRITAVTWIAVTLFMAEGIILMTNGWRCPLTTYAEKLGSTHGQITDTFLPKWFADRIFKIYTVLYAGSLVVLVIRLLDLRF